MPEASQEDRAYSFIADAKPDLRPVHWELWEWNGSGDEAWKYYGEAVYPPYDVRLIDDSIMINGTDCYQIGNVLQSIERPQITKAFDRTMYRVRITTSVGLAIEIYVMTMQRALSSWRWWDSRSKHGWAAQQPMACLYCQKLNCGIATFCIRCGGHRFGPMMTVHKRFCACCGETIEKCDCRRSTPAAATR